MPTSGSDASFYFNRPGRRGRESLDLYIKKVEGAVRDGNNTVIIGRSGKGKTSVLSHVAEDYPNAPKFDLEAQSVRMIAEEVGREGGGGKVVLVDEIDWLEHFPEDCERMIGLVQNSSGIVWVATSQIPIERFSRGLGRLFPVKITL